MPSRGPTARILAVEIARRLSGWSCEGCADGGGCVECSGLGVRRRTGFAGTSNQRRVTEPNRQSRLGNAARRRLGRRRQRREFNGKSLPSSVLPKIDRLELTDDRQHIATTSLTTLAAGQTMLTASAS